MIQPPQPIPVYDMEKLPKNSIYIKAEERIMNLSLQQKQQLASYIIHSANWDGPPKDHLDERHLLLVLRRPGSTTANHRKV